MLTEAIPVGSNRGSGAPGNYVRISRELEDHPIVGFGQPVKPADPERGAYSRAEAWLFLVFQARWRTAEVNNRGRVIMLERGELLGARAWLARIWNWTENQVRSFLDRLEAEMMIDRKNHQSNHQAQDQSKCQKTAHFANIISIRNYSIYQAAIERFCEEKNQSEATFSTTFSTDKTTNRPPHIKEGKDNNTTLEDPNLGLAPLNGSAQIDEFSWNQNGIVQVQNGSRVSLEKLLNGAATLDEVLVEISPRIPDKPVGRDLVIAVTAAVARHAQELERLRQKRGTRLPRDWKLPKSWGEWAMQESEQDVAWTRGEAAKFSDYWHSQAGAKATKLDWEATWRNWIRNAKKPVSTLSRGQDNFSFSGKYVGRGI